MLNLCDLPNDILDIIWIEKERMEKTDKVIKQTKRATLRIIKELKYYSEWSFNCEGGDIGLSTQILWEIKNHSRCLWTDPSCVQPCDTPHFWIYLMMVSHFNPYKDYKIEDTPTDGIYQFEEESDEYQILDSSDESD